MVSLSFRVLDLESDLCRYDFVDVYDGHINRQRLGRFCGTSRPGALVTNGNKMQVTMVSDANTAGSGFLAVFAAVRPNEKGENTPHCQLTHQIKIDRFCSEIILSGWNLPNLFLKVFFVGTKGIS